MKKPRPHKTALLAAIWKVASDYHWGADLLAYGMAALELEEMHACGCWRGAEVHRCKDHAKVWKRREKLRSCPCGELDRLTAECAEAHREIARTEKRGHFDQTDWWKQQLEKFEAERQAHRCPPEYLLRAYCAGCSRWLAAARIMDGQCSECRAQEQRV